MISFLWNYSFQSLLELLFIIWDAFPISCRFSSLWLYNSLAQYSSFLIKGQINEESKANKDSIDSDLSKINNNPLLCQGKCWIIDVSQKVVPLKNLLFLLDYFITN